MIRIEINGIENKYIIERINKTKIQILKKIKRGFYLKIMQDIEN